jgi:multimeric flavodoxin WrbA
MKVVALNGSANSRGNTYQALQIAAGELEAQDIQVEIIKIGEKDFKGCTGCHSCKAAGRCVLSEPEFTEILEKMYEADGILLGSPVYYGGITGPMKSFLDRAFFSSTTGQLRFKVAASVVVLRRTGAMSAYEQLNNYLLASEMLVVPCQWMAVFGAQPGEIQEDKEGLQRLRNLGKNMAWLLKMKEMTKDTLTMPASEARVFFNMIR